MKIVVCVKQVAALGDEVEFTDDELDVDPDFLDFALNEWDSFATEEALQIRERVGEGEVIVVSVGDEDSEDALRRCLAMGADRGDSHPGRRPVAGSATLARALAAVVGPRGAGSRLLRRAVERRGSGSDGRRSRRASRAAAGCGRDEGRLGSGRARARVSRELEGGLVDLVEVDTPAVLTIQTGINEPRYATLRAIKQAEQKEIEVVEPEGLGRARVSSAADVRTHEGRGRRDAEREPGGDRAADQGDRRGAARVRGLEFHARVTRVPTLPLPGHEPTSKKRTRVTRV